MKQLFPKFFFLPLLLWLLSGGFSAAAQSADSLMVTADSYVRPYNEPFQYGSNVGNYGNGWGDQNLAGIAQQRGVHSLRPTLPEYFLIQNGYGIRRQTFSKYVNELGMKEITCFIGKPWEPHRDTTTYEGSTKQSLLFANLYEPIWRPDGGVNGKNYYADYVYKLLLNYGDKVRFWEVVNEPDFTNGASVTAWLSRAPTPAELLSMRAPLYHYIRMLRITYEVVKKYRPEAYVTTSVGYPEFVDALLRYTDNPDGGAKTAAYPRTAGAYFDVLSYHCYPNYSLHYWDSNVMAFRYRRSSDYAANKVIENKNKMAAVLAKYGYDGTLHPAKLFTLTESNVSRRTSGSRTGSDEAQRNFGIKSLVLTQKNAIRQFYYYSIGEIIDAPPATANVSGADELGLMGLYENLKRDRPGAQKPTPLGDAFKTTSQLLYNYQYDSARTAALELPAAVDGAAFRKDSSYVYVLWARALTDNSEEASASYSFPAAWNVGSVRRAEWDYSVTGTKVLGPPQVALTSSPAFFTTLICTAKGSLTREQWNNVTGSPVSTIPLSTPPSSTTRLTQFEAVTSPGTTKQYANYGARLSGYLCPPQSGAYTFYISGDDQSELWLSTDDAPANKVLIASSLKWLPSARTYTRYAAQRSAVINLIAGERYYVEALHKQSWGPGYVSVAWRLPDGTFEGPIAGSRLSPFAPTSPSPATLAAKGTASALLAAPTLNGTAETATELIAYPNPFSQQATVQFRRGAGGPATLSLYDVRGQLVRQLYQGTGAAGAVQQINLDAQNLSQGIYVLRLVTGQQVLTQKLGLNK